MDLQVAENIILVVGLVSILVVFIISAVKDRLLQAVLCFVAIISISAPVLLIGKSHIPKAQLVQQLNPDVPVKGYKWINAKAWVLYKNGKEDNVVIYER